MAHSVANLVGRQQELLNGLRTRPVLSDPTASFAVRKEQLSSLSHRGRRAISSQLDRESTAVQHHLARVRAMSPKATLERGYAILVAADGHALGSVDQVDPGDELLAHLVDGQLLVAVREVRARGDA
jgi:exodeoxyribonuclease VII large subunit